MAGQRQDYILRQIELLRQFVARLASSGGKRELEEALLLSFHLQEKLFPLPPAQFLQLELAAQVEALRAHENAAAGRENCLTYARLLAETASLYDLKGRNDLADGARQMALYAALCVALDEAPEPAANDLIVDLLPHLDPETFHAPVAELLEEYRRRVDDKPSGA
jgi:hypothetical protein